MNALIEIILFSALIEFATISGRMRFGPMKKRFSRWAFRYKVRIHHGYLGLGMLLLFIFLRNPIVMVLGWSLLISDSLHHFVVLPIISGTTEFP